MAYILNIDTATELASVCISAGSTIVASKQNEQQKEHASFLHVAIEALVKETGISLASMDAIAVTAGPGSYTGLRVGMATAKGFCYALQKPLITVSTLQVLTYAALQQMQARQREKDVLYCPMIDARRMEVFTAVYNETLDEVEAAAAIIVDEDFRKDCLCKHEVYFFGNGSNKIKSVVQHENAKFLNVKHDVTHLAVLASKALEEKDFADIVYEEPMYVKGFYSTQKK